MAEYLESNLWSLVLALAFGRVLLSFLPAGDPGGHTLAKLPATLATSWLLGSIAVGALARVTGASLALAWVPLCVLGLVRWALDPAGLAPRRELRVEPISPIVGIAVLALILAFVPVRACSALALLAFFDHGLRSARRVPLGRWVWVLLLVPVALSYPFSEGIGGVALLSAAGAAFALGWLRRADRRAGVLAALCFSCAALCAPGGLDFALVALVTLVACTARPSRAWIGAVAAAALVAALLLRLGDYERVADRAFGPGPVVPFLLALLAATLGWGVRAAVARYTPEVREARARGNVFLLVLLVEGALVCTLVGSIPSLVLVPIAFLCAACVSLRPDRMLGRGAA